MIAGCLIRIGACAALFVCAAAFSPSAISQGKTAPGVTQHRLLFQKFRTTCEELLQQAGVAASAYCAGRGTSGSFLGSLTVTLQCHMVLCDQDLLDDAEILRAQTDACTSIHRQCDIRSGPLVRGSRSNELDRLQTLSETLQCSRDTGFSCAAALGKVERKAVDIDDAVEFLKSFECAGVGLPEPLKSALRQYGIAHTTATTIENIMALSNVARVHMQEFERNLEKECNALLARDDLRAEKCETTLLQYRRTYQARAVSEGGRTIREGTLRTLQGWVTSKVFDAATCPSSPVWQRGR